ncbi:hypothetical protein [Flavobacterium sp.]|jgi:hypothetical protein|uniref:hypothetical protein n=1 Tax=Flavobacterium sp. TaxID=239 RepID=UPI0037BFE994
MKKLLVLFLLATAVGFAQNLNGYKYAIVPSKFLFLKEENMYNLNLLTKMYLQKYGFETYYNTETAPDEFVNSNCNKIYIDVSENNSMLNTKLRIVVKDCKGTVLATSEEGTSREKEHHVAYNLALRMAFDNFGILKMHKFQPTEKSLVMIGEPKEVIVSSEYKEALDNGTIVTTTIIQNQLVAKPIRNGFQLNNAESKEVYKIYATSVKDYFIATKGDLNGVFFIQNNKGTFEYYQNEKLITEIVDVKF